MLIAFFIELAIVILLYLVSAKRYAEFLEPLSEKDFRLLKIMPAALFIMEKAGCKYNSMYDRRLLVKVGEIYGGKYAQYHLRIHWANKIAFIILGLLFVPLIGIGAETIAEFAVYNAILLGVIVFFTDKELDEKIKKRRIAIVIDFPDFINKLTLLVNAGMTVQRAWEKIVYDNSRNTPLYTELEKVLLDIQSGKSEQNAYEEFAKRCRIQEITKFISVILQNLRKGNAELTSILRVQAAECWEMRKNAAKRLGEEASTKMLLPMMIMFAAILIIVAAPAVLSLRGI